MQNCERPIALRIQPTSASCPAVTLTLTPPIKKHHLQVTWKGDGTASTGAKFTSHRSACTRAHGPTREGTVRPVTCDKPAPRLAWESKHVHKNIATKNPHNSHSALNKLTCSKLIKSHYKYFNHKSFTIIATELQQYPFRGETPRKKNAARRFTHLLMIFYLVILTW